ncbi:Protein CBG14827 [Caenorhabditis briggsae]|uniref:Protein CBG14827 n=1 Tax=Caenorhabditis briggsae TaxID=6238 RepID=A8XKS4_CAEBR|nr:Protein CBG14827 [Caenorhabditis briggsae]CAP33248.2 Protein CBG14827 [Caenorhabditis briggsae]
MTSKQKSLVWDFFEKTENGTQVVCRKCQTKLKYFGSTSGMLKHVESNHQDELIVMGDDKIKSEPISASIQYANISEALNELASTMCTNGAPLSLRTTVKQKSLVWDFFEKSEDGTQVSCQKCRIQLKYFGATSGMLKHIESNHQEDMKIIGNAEIESERNTLPNEHSNILESSNELALIMCSSSFPLGSQMTSKPKSLVWDFFKKTEDGTKVICQKCQTKLKYFGSTSGMLKHVEQNHQEDMIKMGKSANKREKTSASIKGYNESEALNELVLTMCTSSVPLNIGKNEHFQKFIHNLNPEFSLPSTDGVLRHIASTAKSYRDPIKNQLQSVRKCVISLDGWEGKFGNKTLYAMFLYFVDNKFRRTKLFLGICHIEEPVDASKIGKFVLDLLIEYDLDFSKVLGGICESRSNAITFLKRNGRYQRSKLHKISRRIPLLFSDTLWGGCVLLAQAYSDHYESISTLSNFQSYLLSQSEKSTLDEFLECTKPYMEAIQMSEKEETYGSEIIVQYAGLLDFLSKIDQDSDIVRLLKEETTLRYEEYLQNDMALFALYCDPRFVYLADILRNITWSDIEEKVSTYCGINKIWNDFEWEINWNFQTLHASSTQQHLALKDLLRKNQKMMSRISQNLCCQKETPPRPRNQDKYDITEIVAYQSTIQSSRPPTSTDPLNFWMVNSERLPNLSILARHILSSPSSTAQTERLFSKCGNLPKCTQKSRVPLTSFNDIMLNVTLADLQRGTLSDCDSDDLDDDEDEIEVDPFPNNSDSFLNLLQ